MLRKAFLAIALVASLSTSAFAVVNVSAGNHVFLVNSGLQSFPIIGSSDAGENLSGIDLYLVMDQLGPIITNVDLVNGTVFQNSNTGVTTVDPMFLTPGRQPAYGLTTNPGADVGVGIGVVPTGIVAWVTIDTNSALVGQYLLSLENELLGPSSVYNDVGIGGTITNGSVTLQVPEPGSVVLALFGAAGLGAVAIRRRRARKA